MTTKKKIENAADQFYPKQTNAFYEVSIKSVNVMLNQAFIDGANWAVRNSKKEGKNG